MVARATISKHLKVLEKAGLVKRSIEGRIHRFEMETSAMREAQDWISNPRAFWEGTLDSLEIFLGSLEKSNEVSSAN